MISASLLLQGVVHQILDMQMQPSASCARMWTVLSAGSIMFADKPHRLNERTKARSDFVFLTNLAPVTALAGLGYRAAGYRAAISCVDQFGHRSEECNAGNESDSEPSRQGHFPFTQ